VIAPRGTPCIDHHHQNAGVLAFLLGLSMLREQPAGQPDQMIGMMDHIGHNGAGSPMFLVLSY
jgi:hypothetical protein